MKVNIHTLILFFLLLLPTTKNFAFYNQPDSLETQLRTAVNEEEKIYIRNQLAELYFKYNVNRSLEYLETNLTSPSIKNSPKLQAKSFYLKGRASLLLADFEKANIFLHQAKDYFFQNNQYKELGDCYKDLGTTQLHQTKFADAEEFYLQGIEAYQKGNYPAGLGHCNLNLGNVFIEQFMYAKGIQYYYNALEKYEELGLHRYIGMCNNNIGNIYKEIENFEKATAHYEKATASYQVDNDSLQIINVNLNIGATYLDKGEYNRATIIFEKVLKDAKATGFGHPIPVIYNNLVVSYINFNNLELAEKNNKLALEYAQLNKNKIEKIRAHLLAAEIHLRKKEFNQSLALGNEAYEKAEYHRQIGLMSDAAQVLYAAHKGMNHFEESLNYLELHKSHQDSLFSENRMKIPWSKDLEYQLEKQRREQVLQQEKEKMAWESKLAFQRLILFVFGICFLILGLSAFIIFKNYRAKRLAEGELEKKNSMLEKYIESNIQLEQFAHIASHDLKSPLRTVGSFSSLLKRRAADKLNENELEYLDMISNAAKLMWNLVDDLMTYSQVNSLQMNLTPNNVNHLLQDVLNNLDFSIKEKDADIQVANLPKTILADDTKIRQVFQNLIANSLKFTTPERTPEIKIDCVAKGDFWKFSVQDNGIGISEEYLEKIFKPYKQLHTKDKYEGTGMGLAICKKIVEKHGGEISVTSEEGKGTTFYFTIPKSLEKNEMVEMERAALA